MERRDDGGLVGRVGDNRSHAAEIATIALCGLALVSCTHDFEVIVRPYDCETLQTTPPTEVCYRFSPVARTWLEAELDCEADGPTSHLAVDTGSPEHEVLHALVGGEAWVGNTDLVTERANTWVTFGGGRLLPDEDAPHFGNQNEDTADCVTLSNPNKEGDWYHRNCMGLFPYLCERDGNPADPSQYTPSQTP